ncbi:MAG TPA: glucose-6-phosphate isomerase [Chloroflexota bacterium]|nr:glucose-6-phosphate isomerase [Chloroflexota bacterium]
MTARHGAAHHGADWRAQRRVRLDYTNLLAAAVGAENGVSESELGAMAPRAAAAVSRLQQMRTSGQVEWLDLPYQREVAEQVVSYADGVAARCDAFVVLGIGGSALGAIALQTALRPLFYNQLRSAQRRRRPRVYVLDNVDPDFVAAALGLLDPRRTVFNVVTKSGSTAETMAQLVIARERLRAVLGEETAEHIVATTDPEHGDLRKLAEAEGYHTFSIPPTVGGRFSVLSPAGLLPAAVSGIDVHELLAGAAEADGYCRDDDLWVNPALFNATAQYLLYQRGKRITVMMPYSQRLRDLAGWFRQLWAESLGKTKTVDGKIVSIGPTPVQALGVTDQHSQVQLYMDGPADKVFTFIGVDRFDETVRIPAAGLGRSSLDYLGGHTLNELINAERLATTLALTANHRPSCTFLLPEVCPFTVGQLLYVLEVQTALIGFLFGIDPFNQPGVEAGKVATYALLGRPGFEAQAAEIARQIGAPRQMI